MKFYVYDLDEFGMFFFYWSTFSPTPLVSLCEVCCCLVKWIGFGTVLVLYFEFNIYHDCGWLIKLVMVACHSLDDIDIGKELVN